MFMICHLLSLFFIKTKDEKLSAFVCLFVCFFLFIEITEKVCATLVIFSFFLLKWNCGKLGDRYAIFLFFHFLNTMKKNEKMVRINIVFFIFTFFYFGGKIEK